MSNPPNPFAVGSVPIPNEFFDVWLPTLTEGEVCLLLVVFRATLGWRDGDQSSGPRFKRRDWLTHSQLIKRTGKSSGTISNAVATLVNMGLIVTESTDGTPLTTPEMRRRYIGRVYFRPGDMWITPQLGRTVQPLTTTKRLYNNNADVRVRRDYGASHSEARGMQRVGAMLPQRNSSFD